MRSATQYRDRAEELHYRACLTPDPLLREQLHVAARDYRQMAQTLEDEGEAASADAWEAKPPTSAA